MVVSVTRSDCKANISREYSRSFTPPSIQQQTNSRKSLKDTHRLELIFHKNSEEKSTISFAKKTDRTARFFDSENALTGTSTTSIKHRIDLADRIHHIGNRELSLIPMMVFLYRESGNCDPMKPLNETLITEMKTCPTELSKLPEITYQQRNRFSVTYKIRD